jgi:hypothetical protein
VGSSLTGSAPHLGTREEARCPVPQIDRRCAARFSCGSKFFSSSGTRRRSIRAAWYRSRPDPPGRYRRRSGLLSGSTDSLVRVPPAITGDPAQCPPGLPTCPARRCACRRCSTRAARVDAKKGPRRAPAPDISGFPLRMPGRHRHALAHHEVRDMWVGGPSHMSMRVPRSLVAGSRANLDVLIRRYRSCACSDQSSDYGKRGKHFSHHGLLFGLQR